jgi:GTPase SAR1 family protein
LIGDFAGEGRFRFMFPEYIYGAVGGILLYDITDKTSFYHIKNWLYLIRKTNQNFPIVLAGSKYDLDDIREISWEEGVGTAKTIGMNGFIEYSSKTGENVNELFSGLLKLMANRKIYDIPKIQSVKV